VGSGVGDHLEHAPIISASRPRYSTKILQEEGVEATKKKEEKRKTP
jgi:hypothetical protein